MIELKREKKNNELETWKDLQFTLEKNGLVSALRQASEVWSKEEALSIFEEISFSDTSRKNVQCIATIYPRAYNGGIERVQAQLMELWCEMGYRVVLFTEEPENKLDYYYPSEVQRVVIPNASMLEERLQALKDNLEQLQVDIVINNDWSNDAVIWELMLCKLMGIPFVQYIHAHFAWNYIHGKAALNEPGLYKMCDLVLSLSETNARYYQMCGCNSYLVQNPIPKDLLAISGNSQASLCSKRILLIGRLSVEKRPLDALRVFKIVKEKVPEAVLDIVGGDDYNFFNQIKEYCKTNQLENSVILHGMKSAEEIKKYYQNASIMIFTSEMEGYPMVLLESKAYGLPCVMYDLSYLSLIKDKKGVITVPIGDIQSMSENIIALLNNLDYRKKMGREARESFDVLKEYDLKNTWKNIINICVDQKENIDKHVFFQPQDLAASEQWIMPILLDRIKMGYDYTISNDIDHKVGKKVLFFPRIFVRSYRKIRRIFDGQRKN